MLSMDWFLAIEVIGVTIMLAGFITSRNLPEPAKKVRIKKIAAIGLILVAISFPIFQPSISSHSETGYLNELKSENLGSVDEIIKLDKEQTKNIEALKREVENLREDMDLLNRYYGIITSMLSFALAMFLSNIFFRKEKSEE